MNLSQWLNHITTLNPKTIVLGLERVAVVADKLQLNKFNCSVIAVTGTNGKGSCVAYLEAIYTAAGYQVGAYASPHLLRFNERIRINQIEITDDKLCAAFAAVEQARAGVPLTYFEFTTLAALLLFKQAGLDILLLEVGLGGRLDAINVVDADLTIITSIALDHLDYLGDNREAIGREKAGLFCYQKLAVCGDSDPPVSVLQTAKDLQVQLYCINQAFNYQRQSNSWYWQSTHSHYSNLPIPQLPLVNAATALQAIELLQTQLPVTAENIVHGLANAKLPGRFQHFDQPVVGILDVAHNPAAAMMLAQRLQEEPCAGRTLAVVSILADKDIRGTLQPLLSEVDSWFVAGLAEPRGSKTEMIIKHLQALMVTDYFGFASVEAAFKEAVNVYRPGDRILVFGSFYTVALVIKYLQNLKCTCG